MRCAFIENNRQEWPVRRLCRLLSISPSTFYDWRSQKRKSKHQRAYELLRVIEKIFHGSGRSYGSPRIWRHVKALGYKVSKATVERIMREYGLRAKKKGRFVVTTNSQHDRPIAPNVVDRHFDRGAADRVWLSDITYIPTEAGWVYLATVMDGHSRRILGWSLSESLNRSLVINALKAALIHRSYPKGVILHSDRGSQYASLEYITLIEKNGLTQSMSRKGNCWDNAPMESFFDSLKTEYVHGQNFTNIEEAYRGLFWWIEVQYNRNRMHSSLGYRSPACFEEETVALAA